MNLKTIAIVVSLLTVFSGALYKAWSMESAISDNTRYRLERQYDSMWDRIEKLTDKCGKQAKRCDKESRDNYRRWTIKKDRLKSKLGY